MNKIIKIFGLPRTGTNLMEKACILNFKDQICQKADYHPDYHYLGWKHGKPKPIETYDIIGKHLNYEVYFIFMIREFKSWQKSIFTNHLNSWEFPLSYFNMGWDKFIYNTPIGPEFYKNALELYEEYNSAYISFFQNNPQRSIFITFEELSLSQKNSLFLIKEKFNLEYSHESFYEVKKRVDSGGRINDFIA